MANLIQYASIDHACGSHLLMPNVGQEWKLQGHPDDPQFPIHQLPQRKKYLHHLPSGTSCGAHNMPQQS